MSKKIDSILRWSCELISGVPILAGVSGGPDSLCLLGVLHTAGYPVIVAHFNHKLRPEADLEADDVAERARALGLPFVTDSADVSGYAGEHSLSLEEAARTLRYRFLFKAARQNGAQAVAVGHTADDQAETVLMHFLRGAGLAGLKGMEYRTLLPVFESDIPLVRPLLSLWRADTEAYCREHNLQPHFDASNADTVYFRNRLRHALIPELEKYNPRFKEALVRTAQALQGDYSALQAVLQAAWQKVVVETGKDWVAFDQPAMVSLSPALRRNLIRRAGESLRPDNRDFGFDTLERAAAFADSPTVKQVDFANGLYLFAESGKIYLAAYEADLPFGNWLMVDGEWELKIGQPLTLGNGWVLAAEKCFPDTDPSTSLRAGNWSLNTDPWQAWLDADLTGDRLTVRPRRAGDVFSPLGMARQTIKLREFFINVKLPQRARTHWPLVCSGEQIVWVPGYRIAHPFRVTEKTKRVVRLVLRKDRADT